MGRMRGIRGATTADENSSEAIIEATSELLRSLVEANDVQLDDIAAVQFTSTADLDAEFPALAARKIGWVDVALLGSIEVDVAGATEKCIRILLLVNTDKTPQDIQFKYLKGAANLRSRGMPEV
jgi:chorismate mutase